MVCQRARVALGGLFRCLLPGLVLGSWMISLAYHGVISGRPVFDNVKATRLASHRVASRVWHRTVSCRSALYSSASMVDARSIRRAPSTAFSDPHRVHSDRLAAANHRAMRSNWASVTNCGTHALQWLSVGSAPTPQSDAIPARACPLASQFSAVEVGLD